MQLPELLQLAGAAVGTVGGVLLFIEFFQLPSYVEYTERTDSYNVVVSPRDVQQHTAAGRAGALAVALGFALLFAGILAA